MLPTRCVEAAAARGAGDHADLDEIGFDHFLDRIARFAEARGERLHPDRTAAIDVGDHGEVAAVHRVETERVDLQPGERGIGGAGMSAAALAHFVAHFERLTRHALRVMPRQADLVVALDAARGARVRRPR